MERLTSEFMEATIRVLRKHKQTLLERVIATEREIEEVDSQIQQFRSAIKAAQKNGRASSEPGKPRRERGANVRLIKEWFSENPQHGFTIRELEDGTGLPHGSIHNVLAKEGNGYWKNEETGKWWREEDRPQDVVEEDAAIGLHSEPAS